MRIRFPAFAAMTACLLLSAAIAQEPSASTRLTTDDRLDQPGWWPTKGDAARELYTGSEACAGCHTTIAAHQETTPMFHAAVRAAQSEILAGQPLLKFQEAGLSYSLTHEAAGVMFSVRDEASKNEAAVTWALGQGVVGQTYLLEKSGAFIEGRVSYFTRISALDITTGHSANPPSGADTALGHMLTGKTARLCFGCHTTVAAASNVFEPEKAVPGIHCEACHGPGAKHVAAMQSRQLERASATIVNPAHLAAVDSVDFCGACHRTWADVVMKSPSGIGIATVRFQPYRLENSRCWGKNGDARITCIACHDPHEPLVREASAYDAKCLACHAVKQEASKQAMAKEVCKVGTSKCVSCHMPKYEVPQTHAAFTDHYIRVIRTGVEPGAKALPTALAQ